MACKQLGLAADARLGNDDVRRRLGLGKSCGGEAGEDVFAREPAGPNGVGGSVARGEVCVGADGRAP